MNDDRAPTKARQRAHRWFRIWMGAWIGYVAFIVGTARGENLNATYLLLSTLVTGGVFALALWARPRTTLVLCPRLHAVCGPSSVENSSA